MPKVFHQSIYCIILSHMHWVETCHSLGFRKQVGLYLQSRILKGPSFTPALLPCLVCLSLRKMFLPVCTTWVQLHLFHVEVLMRDASGGSDERPPWVEQPTFRAFPRIRSLSFWCMYSLYSMARKCIWFTVVAVASLDESSIEHSMNSARIGSFAEGQRTLR